MVEEISTLHSVGRAHFRRYGPGSSPRSCSRPSSSGAKSPPRDSQSYDALKVRFSATLGQEPEVEVALV